MNRHDVKPPVAAMDSTLALFRGMQRKKRQERTDSFRWVRVQISVFLFFFLLGGSSLVVQCLLDFPCHAFKFRFDKFQAAFCQKNVFGWDPEERTIE